MQPHDQQGRVHDDDSQAIQLSTDTPADSGGCAPCDSMQPAGSCPQSSSHQQVGGLSEEVHQQNLRGLSSQQVHMGHFSHTHAQQRSPHPTRHQTQQEYESDDKRQDKSDCLGQHESSMEREIELSCSLDEDMVSALDLESSAVSQLISSTAERCSADDQSKGCLAICQASRMGDDGMIHMHGNAVTTVAVGDQDLPFPALARIRKIQPSEQQQCTSLEQEMAASPSAMQGRRKQARLDSMRCLKF